MQALLVSSDLLGEVKSALASAGRDDLAKKLAESERTELTSSEAASLLGVSSTNTVKKWLEGGAFPGAFRTAGGHWRFPLADVLKAQERVEQLRQKNAARDLAPPDGDDMPEPPLL
ncbi:MAG: helix-turn-helix domain-containing protein [Deltaproteobacteria bacterium]|nr:helix-turn-helix domain-containing protein [Deltaproteobacteria bacterium]